MILHSYIHNMNETFIKFIYLKNNYVYNCCGKFSFLIYFYINILIYNFKLTIKLLCLNCELFHSLNTTRVEFFDIIFYFRELK